VLGILTGILMGAFLAVAAVKWEMDQIIAGVVINIVAAGLTSFSPSSFADYTENEKVSATLRAGGGDLGGGSETLLLDGAVYGQSGFAKYTEGVTTLTATSYKRPEDNVVLHES
jgi:ABC-type uncharacterized transport system permease subunit